MEWIKDTGDLVSAYICLAMMMTGAVCAAVRWFHVCAPYRDDADRHYPARRVVAAYFAAQLLFFPYLLRPCEPHSLMYASTLPLILLTTFVPLILYRFFGIGELKLHRVLLACFLLPVALLSLCGVYLLFNPDNIMVTDGKIFILFFGICGLLLSAIMLAIIVWIKRRVDRYNMNSCSNEDDFPVKFASTIPLGVGLMCLMCWVAFLWPGRLMLCFIWVVFSILAIVYGIVVLHPQWGGIAVGEESETAGDDWEKTTHERAGDGQMPFSEEMRRRVIELLHLSYLDPHIKRRDLISQLDYGQRTEAGRVITYYGFYEMVNAVRLEHARLYAKTHPNETLESVAINSGFKDRFAMRHAQKRISEIPGALLENFTPLQGNAN